MIAYCEDVNDANQLQQSLQSRAPDIVNIVRRWFRPPVGTVFDVLGQSRIQGPAILLEYLENGTLLRFLERARGRVRAFPNRLLWSFFFCCNIPSPPFLWVNDKLAAINGY